MSGIFPAFHPLLIIALLVALLVISPGENILAALSSDRIQNTPSPRKSI